MSPINNSSNYLQSILSTALQNSGLKADATGNTSSAELQTDKQHLSPFAQVMSTLQQLQQSDPTKYQQVTQQIATNLQSAAQTAQSDGNSTMANQLNQLATDFTNASKSGQLPNVQDLFQAIGGHRHHRHMHPDQTDSDTDSSATGSSSSATNQPLNQLLSAWQVNGTQNDSLNPMTIIQNTLSSAGIGSAHS